MQTDPDRMQLADSFAAEAQAPKSNVVAEFLAFLSENKKWWLTPILCVLLLAGLLVVLSTTSAGPFIYTLF